MFSASNISPTPDGQNLYAVLMACGRVDIPANCAEFLHNTQLRSALYFSSADLKRFHHKSVTLREVVAHLLLGFYKHDVCGMEMPCIAAQFHEPAIEIGLVMHHEVRKSLGPFARAIRIKDYSDKASEGVILDEYIVTAHHCPPKYTAPPRKARWTVFSGGVEVNRGRLKQNR